MYGTKTPYMLAFLYAFIIGFSFLFTKLALQFANPIDTLAFRFTLSFLALGIPVLAGWIKLDLRLRMVWRLLPIGLVYPSLFFGFQAFGLAETSSSEVGIFQAATPVFTLTLAALFLKERTSWMQKLSVLSSVGGVIYILVVGGASVGNTSAFGIAMLLVSSVMLALYSVLARALRDGFTAVQISFVMMLAGCAGFDAIALTSHALNGTLRVLPEPLTHPVFVIAILYICLLSSLVSSLLSNYVLSRMEAYRMSLFVNLGNLISMLAGVLFLDEHLAYYHLIGAVLIVGGVLGVYYRKRKKVDYTTEVKAG